MWLRVIAAIIWKVLQFTRDFFLPKCFYWISSCVTRMSLKSFMLSFLGKKEIVKISLYKMFRVKFIVQVFEVPYIFQV